MENESFRKDGFQRIVFFRKNITGHLVDFDGRENIFMTTTSSRIAVYRVYQLLDGMNPISCYRSRSAQRRSYKFIIDDKRTIVIALDEFFDDNGIGKIFCPEKTCRCL